MSIRYILFIYYVFESSPQFYEVCTVNIPILQMRTLRHRTLKQFAKVMQLIGIVSFKLGVELRS